MSEEIPGRHHAVVAHDLNNSIGFVVSEAAKSFGLKAGETALFWALVATVAQHTVERPRGEP